MTLRVKSSKNGSAEVRLQFLDEEVDARFEAFVPSETRNKLINSQFKVRVEGGDELLEILRNAPTNAVEAEIIFCWLKRKTGYKDSNFQVLHRLFTVLDYLVTTYSTFNAAVAAVAVPSLVEKISDAKLKQVTSECLNHMIESVGLQAIYVSAMSSLALQKAPKIISDALQWMATSLTEFGIRGLKVKELIEFLKTHCLESSNPSVRSSAIHVLTVLHIFLGAPLRTLVEDVKPALLAVIDAEFSKVANQTPPVPTRFVKGQSAALSATIVAATGLDSSSKAAGAVTTTHYGVSGQARDAVHASDALGSNELDELIPRTDITTQLSVATLKELGDTQWKLREAALGQIMRTLQSSKKRILPNLGPDLLPALKARFGDSNRNLCVVTLHLLGVLAESIGKPFEQHLKTIFHPMLGCLNDGKPQVRSACLSAMDAIHQVVGLVPLMGGIESALHSESSVLRRDLLCWLEVKLQLTVTQCGIPLEDHVDLLKSFFACMEDRNAETRKFAQGCLLIVARAKGIDFIKKHTDGLKPASLQHILTFCDKHREKITTATSDSTSTSTGAAAVAATTPVTDAMSSSPGKGKLNARSSAVTPRKTSKVIVHTALSKAAAPATTILPLAGNSNIQQLSEQSPWLPLQESHRMSTKEQRSEREKTRLRWFFEGMPRDEFYDTLREQMEGSLSDALIGCLFALDFKEVLAALQTIDDFLTGNVRHGIDELDTVQRIISSMDLILKYLTLKFSDTNTTIQLKCLDILEHMLDVADRARYVLSEYETGLFLPIFVHTQLGDAKESIRVRAKQSLHRIAATSHASMARVTMALIEGLKSKNVRVRCGALEEMAHIVREWGLQVGGVTLGKALPCIAIQVSDRDASVRQASLLALQETYLCCGDTAFYRLLGKMTDKELAPIQERLKRLPKPKINEHDVMAATASISVSQTPSKAYATASIRSNGGHSGIDTAATASPAVAAVSRVHSAQWISTPGRKTAVLPKRGSSFSLDLETLQLPPLHTNLDLKKPSVLPSSSSSLSLPVAFTGTPTLPWRQRTVGYSSDQQQMQQQQHHQVLDNQGLQQLLSFESRRHHPVPAIVDRLKEAHDACDVGAYSAVVTDLEDIWTSNADNDSHDQRQQQQKMLAPHMDSVLPPLVDTLREHISHESHRKLCKHIIIVLAQIYSHHCYRDLDVTGGGVSMHVNEYTLYMLLECVIDILEKRQAAISAAANKDDKLDDGLNNRNTNSNNNSNNNDDSDDDDSGGTLGKGLNAVLTKVLEHSKDDAARMLCVLIRLLENRPSSGVVMKCVWKLTKRIKEHELTASVVAQYAKIIMCIHEFLTIFPPVYWKRKVMVATIKEDREHGDLPLRTVKTLVYEIVKKLNHRWEEVFKGNIPEYQTSYVYLMTQALLTMTTVVDDDDCRHDQQENRREETPNQEQQLAVERLFKKIANKDQTKEGLGELYEWKKEHAPAMEIFNEALGASSEFMQGYIRRGLASLDDQKKRSELTPTKSSMQDDPADIYRAKLQRLQKLYGLKMEEGTPVSPSFAFGNQRTLLQSPALNPTRGGSPASSTLTAGHRASVKTSMVDDNAIMDIKERLARIRVTIKNDSL